MRELPETPFSVAVRAALVWRMGLASWKTLNTLPPALFVMADSPTTPEYRLAPQPMQPAKRMSMQARLSGRSVSPRAIDDLRAHIAHCPCSTRADIERWVYRHVEIERQCVPIVVDASGVLDRKMPEDFILAEFGEIDVAPRRALMMVMSAIGDGIAPAIVPIDGGVMLKARTVFATIRPAQRGVILALAHSDSETGTRRERTQIHFIRDGELLPAQVVAQLQRAADCHR